MNLTELLEEFKEATGRIDFTDAMATKFLNRGVKFLDEISLKVEQPSRYYSVLKANDNQIVLHQDVRGVTSVWSYTIDERVQLKYITLEEMRELYKNNIVGNGTPEFYAFSPTRVAGDNSANQQTSLWAHWADFSPSEQIKDGMLIYPSPATDFAIELLGNFYTQKLSAEYEENWWTVRHPELVIQAAVYRMDNNYRNTQGGKELLDNLNAGVTNIYYDELETQLHRSSVMGG